MRDHATDQGHGVPIGQAADRLGISENAVRQRIKRGTLAATKVDGIWRVVVPTGRDHEADQEADYQTDYETDQSATTSPPSMSPAAVGQLAAITEQWLQPLISQIRELERDVGRLTAERDQARRERDESRAKSSSETKKVDPAESTPRPWWRFWN